MRLLVAWFRWLRTNWPQVAWFTVLYLVCVLSVRDFLFGNGFAAALTYPTGYSSATAQRYALPYTFDIFRGYLYSTVPSFQLFIDAPYLLANSPVEAQKVSVVLVISAYFLLSLGLSKVLYATFSAAHSRFILFGSLFVLASFANPFAMVAMASGLHPPLFGYLLLGYVLVKLYRLGAGLDGRRIDFVKIGIATSIASYGDQMYFVWIAIILIICLLVETIFLGQARKFLKASAVAVLISLPTIVISYTTLVFGSGSALYTSPRPVTLASLSHFAATTGGLNALELIGFPWPAPILSPPSIELFPYSAVTKFATFGYPPVVVLPGGLVQVVWQLSFLVLPVAALLPLFQMKRRPSLILLYPPFLLFVILAMATNVSTVVGQGMVALSEIPGIGGILGITFAVPSEQIQVVASFVLILSSPVLVAVCDNVRVPFSSVAGNPARKRERDNVRNNASLLRSGPTSESLWLPRVTIVTLRSHVRRGPRAFATPLLVIVIGALLLGGWQAWNGSYYPGNYVPVLPGNGVPPIGTLAPTSPPADWLTVYDSLARSDNGSYAIGWSPPYGFSYQWSEVVTPQVDPGVVPSPQFYTNLSEIMAEGRPDLTKALMDFFGVRYFVVDNTTTVSNVNYLDFFRASSGLISLTAFPPDLWVFEDSNATLYSNANPSVVSLESPARALEVGSILDRDFGSPPILVPPSNAQSVPGLVNASLDSNVIDSNAVSILDRSVLAYRVSLPELPDGPLVSAVPTPMINSVVGSGWVLSNGYLPDTLTLENGTASIATSSNTSGQLGLVVLSYLRLLLPNTTAIEVPNYNSTGVILNWSFQYKSSGDVSYVQAGVVSNNYQLQGNFTKVSNFPAASNWSSISGSIEVPAGARTFTFFVQSALSGSISIKNLSITYGLVVARASGVFTSPTPIPIAPSSESTVLPTTPASRSNVTFPAGTTNGNIGNNWTISNAVLEDIVQVQNGALSIATSSNTSGQLGLVVLSYLRLLLPNTTAIEVPNYNSTGVILNWSFQYKSSGDVSYVQAGVVSNNYQLQGNFTTSVSLVTGPMWRGVNVTMTIPSGARTFAPSIQASLSGSLEIRDLQVSYSFYHPSRGVSVTTTVPLRIPPVSLIGLGYMFGNGSLSIASTVLNLNLKAPTLIDIPINSSTEGAANLTISGLSISDVVILTPQLRTDLASVRSGTSFRHYDAFAGEVQLSISGNGFVSCPSYGWKTAGEGPVFVDLFGQAVYRFFDQPNATLVVEGDMIVNLVLIVYPVALLGVSLVLFIVPVLKMDRTRRATAPTVTPKSGHRSSTPRRTKPG